MLGNAKLMSTPDPNNPPVKPPGPDQPHGPKLRLLRVNTSGGAGFPTPAPTTIAAVPER